MCELLLLAAVDLHTVFRYYPIYKDALKAVAVRRRLNTRTLVDGAANTPAGRSPAPNSPRAVSTKPSLPAEVMLTMASAALDEAVSEAGSRRGSHAGVETLEISAALLEGDEAFSDAGSRRGSNSGLETLEIPKRVQRKSPQRLSHLGPEMEAPRRASHAGIAQPPPQRSSVRRPSQAATSELDSSEASLSLDHMQPPQRSSVRRPSFGAMSELGSEASHSSALQHR